MAYGGKRKPKRVGEPQDIEANENKYFDPTVNNASELIERESSALSLDGKSLIVPNYGDIDDMSSLGTSKYHSKRRDESYKGGNQTNIEYIGDIKIVRKTQNQSRSTSAKRGNNRNEINLSQSYEEKKVDDYTVDRSCIPRWIRDAPTWLKMIIVASIALILGAVVLIVVGAKLTMSPSSLFENQSATASPKPSDVTPQTEIPAASTEFPSQSVVKTTSNPTEVPTVAPTVAPTEALSEATNSSISNSMLTNSTITNSTTVNSPTASPTVSLPSASPTAFPTNEASSAPTETPTISTINLFIMGGRFDGEDTTTLIDGLHSLPEIDGNTILVHLGDFNSPYATSCVESSFTTTVNMYMQSSIPVYFVPGDNEYNDCPNATEAMGYWKQHMLGFETKYWPRPSWEIRRQAPEYSENFAFLQRDILFIGLNLPGGIVHDRDEWYDRHEANLEWINATATNYTENYTTMVVLAHADPTIEINDYFFQGFYSLVETNGDKRVIFVHRNLGVDNWKREHGYNEISNLDVVTVEGSVWPPLWMQIDPMHDYYGIDQSWWYDDYIKKGRLASGPW